MVASNIEKSYSLQVLRQLSLSLKNLAHHVARNYLREPQVKRHFLAEIQQLISQCESDFAEGRTNLSTATGTLQQEYNHLKKANHDLFAQRMQQWVIIEAEKKEESDRNGWRTLAIKQIGFVGGGTQILAGVGACAGTLGIGCASFGGGLIAHGTNNIFENGYYLLFRKEKNGYIKQIYQVVATQAGFTEKDGANAFAVVDLGLSAKGLVTKVIRPDAWQLFRYLNQDKIYGFRKMKPLELTLEILSDSATAMGIEKE